MRDDYCDRPRDDCRPRRARRRDDARESDAPHEGTSALGIIALVLGVCVLVVSLIPCVGALVIPLSAVVLAMAVASFFIAKRYRHGTSTPVTATVVSGFAIMVSLMWIALLGMLFRSEDRHAAPRPVPIVTGQPHGGPPVMVSPAPQQPARTKAEDEQFEKKLLEDLAKDRIKEAIRNGPGTPVTATELEAAYATNVVSADLNYKDKVLEVSGKVIRVVRDPAKSVYTLELETGEPTKTVSCDFTEQTKYPLARVQRGQQVRVRGQCAGQVNEFVKLKDCVVPK